MNLRHSGQNRSRPYQVTNLAFCHARYAVNQGTHSGETQIQPSLLDLRFCRRYKGHGCFVRLDVVIKLGLRDRALLGKRSITCDIQLGFAELRLCLCELTLCLCECGLKRTRVDLKQHLTFVDRGAFYVALLC